MSRLSVHHQTSPQVPNKVLNHAEDIASTLAAVGIELRSLALNVKLQPGLAEQEVLAAIAEPLEQLKREHGLVHVEVINIDRNRWPSEDELPPAAPRELIAAGKRLYLFLGGQAQLNLHIGDEVYGLVGERNDLLVVPEGTRFWLNLGEFARCLALVLSAAGSTADRLSGDDIAVDFEASFD